MTELLTVKEVADLLRVSEWTVAAMTRDGRLPKVPMLRRIRIPLAAVLRLMEGVYDEPDAKPDREAPQEAPAPRRGYGRASQGSLAGAPMGSGGPVHGRIGPAPGDVVIRRVETRGR